MGLGLNLLDLVADHGVHVATHDAAAWVLVEGGRGFLTADDRSVDVGARDDVFAATGWSAYAGPSSQVTVAGDLRCIVVWRACQAGGGSRIIDPAKLGAVGFSAGAHLSMMLGTMDKDDGFDDVGEHRDQPSKVQAVVSYFGPTDLLQPYPDATKPSVVFSMRRAITTSRIPAIGRRTTASLSGIRAQAGAVRSLRQ